MVSVLLLPPPPSARCPCKRFSAWANAVIAGMLSPLLSNRGLHQALGMAAFAL